RLRKNARFWLRSTRWSCSRVRRDELLHRQRVDQSACKPTLMSVNSYGAVSASVEERATAGVERKRHQHDLVESADMCVPLDSRQQRLSDAETAGRPLEVDREIGDAVVR